MEGGKSIIKGAEQSCSLSPILFLDQLQDEVQKLGIYLKKNPDVKLLRLGGLFVDDCSCNYECIGLAKLIDVVKGFPPICTELTTKDLWSIQEAVFEARTKWYDIGLALDVDVSTLDSIDKQFDNHGDKLRTTLTTWLRTATEPKWQAVVNALKNPVVGRPDLAKDIKDKHCNRAETGPTTTEPVLLALRDSHIKNIHLMEEYVERHKETIAELQSIKHRLQQAQQEVEEKQCTIQQLSQDLEWHKQTNEAASHRLRQELQQAQAEVEEKQHAPKPSTRQLQGLNELQQTTTKVQQPPMKQNTIQVMKWDKESTAPEKMFRGSAASDLNRAYFNGRGSTKIHSYDSDTQKWDELPIPDTPHTQHALVIVKDLLTIVGGFSNGRATDSILQKRPC